MMVQRTFSRFAIALYPILLQRWDFAWMIITGTWEMLIIYNPSCTILGMLWVVISWHKKLGLWVFIPFIQSRWGNYLFCSRSFGSVKRFCHGNWQFYALLWYYWEHFSCLQKRNFMRLNVLSLSFPLTLLTFYHGGY